MTRQCGTVVKRMGIEISKFPVNPNATVGYLSKVTDFKTSVIEPVVRRCCEYQTGSCMYTENRDTYGSGLS